MTDRQLINRLRMLVKTMYMHIDNGCSDYSPWDGMGGCLDCRHARQKKYQCAKVEDMKRRMKECGIDWEEMR